MSLFPALTRSARDPWAALRRELDAAFDRGWPGETGDGFGAYPADIRETADQVIVEAELPGFEKKDVDVRLEHGVLTIQAQREDRGAGQRHLSERQFTRVSRILKLPKPVDEQNVEAQLQDGVLTLKLNKTEDATARTIEIR